MIYLWRRGGGFRVAAPESSSGTAVDEQHRNEV